MNSPNTKIYIPEETELFMEKRLEIIDTNIHIIEKLIETLPTGKLKIDTSSHRQTVYKYFDDSDGKYKYIKHGSKTPSKLAQSKYLSQVLVHLKNERKRILPFITSPYSLLINESFNKLSSNRKSLVTNYQEQIRQSFINSWKKQAFIKQEFYDDDPEIYTSKGMRVKSKSERDIANELDSLGIIYFYTPQLKFNNKIVYPDFYILNSRTLKIYIYEHFGRMDDPSYANKTIQKIETYAKNGYILGENLIATFESSSQPLSLQTIKRTIKRYFI